MKTAVSSRIFLVTLFISMQKLMGIFLIIECKSVRKFCKLHDTLECFKIYG